MTDRQQTTDHNTKKWAKSLALVISPHNNNHHQISIAPLDRDFQAAGGRSRKFQLYARELLLHCLHCTVIQLFGYLHSCKCAK